ncbi:MAG: glycosyltransferase family 10 [Desulfobacterales bacterium]
MVQEKVILGLRDKHFAHTHSASNGDLPSPGFGFEWDRVGRQDIMVFTDTSLEEVHNYPDSYNVAWMLESPTVTKRIYRGIRRNHSAFDRILTFDRKLLESTSKAKFNPFGGTWIPFDEWQIHKKKNNISIIASHKNDLKGQKLRHRIVQKFGDSLDAILGYGYHPVNNKLEGLRDYRFSIAVENCRADYYFSEKLIDCFATGTIPVYWGCLSIDKFFDVRGMACFKSLRQLSKLLPKLNKEFYMGRLSSVKKNFEIAQRYKMTESFVFENLQDVLGFSA